MATSSKRTYATCHASQTCCSQSRCPQCRPLLTRASAGDTQTLKGRSGSVSGESLGPSVHKVLFEPSEHLWWVWGLILNAILPLLLSYWGFSFALGCGVSFFGGIIFSSVQFSHSVVSNSLQPHGLQHARPPCPSPTPGVYSNSCPLGQ